MAFVVSSEVGVTDADRRVRIYRGEVFCFPACESGRALVTFASEMIADAFGRHDPLTAHHALSVEEYIKIIGPLKTNFTHHPRSMELMRDLLMDLGADPAQTYVDVPRLRISAPAAYLSAGLGYNYKPHRDTWYSAPQCVNNWWVPIAGNSADTGMQFHPDYWELPAENTSADFDAYEWNRTSRRDAAIYIKEDPRPHPRLATGEPRSNIRIVGEAGSILSFSGAQLHSTVPNETSGARLSLDFRTVHIDDLAAQLGPANIDSRSTGTSIRDYIRADNHQQLPDDIIALYDKDGKREGVLVFDPSVLESQTAGMQAST
jgi:hypothetical protein